MPSSVASEAVIAFVHCFLGFCDHDCIFIGFFVLHSFSYSELQEVLLKVL